MMHISSFWLFNDLMNLKRNSFSIALIKIRQYKSFSRPGKVDLQFIIARMVFEESSNKFHFHYQSRDFYYASYRYVEQDFQFMANYTVATAIIIVVRESMYNCNSLISP